MKKNTSNSMNVYLLAAVCTAITMMCLFSISANAAVTINGNRILMNVITSPPTIGDPTPATTYIYETEAINLIITYTGEGVTLQWEVSIDGGSTWTAIPGATTDTLAIASAMASDSGLYRCVATNPAGSATSANPALVVVNTPNDVVVTSTPAADPVCVAPSATCADGLLDILVATSVTYTVTISPAGSNPATLNVADVVGEFVKSIDDGATWAPMVDDGGVHVTITSLALVGSDLVATMTITNLADPADDGMYSFNATCTAHVPTK